MPDDIPELPLTPPEGADSPAPPETPAKNVTDESGATPRETGLVAKLLAAGKAFKDSAGRVWLKTGGRPRKDGKAGSGDILLEAPAAAPAATADATLAAVADAKALPDSNSLFRKAIVGAARSVFGILGDVIKIFGREPFGEKFCDEIVAKAKPDPAALDEWSDSLETLLAKHNIKTANAPEYTFALNTLRMLAPYGLILAEIRAEIARKRALENQPPKK